MIDPEDFAELFYRIMGGQMSEVKDAIQEGRAPEIMDFREFVGTLYTVTRPDVTCVKLDVSDRVKQLPGSDNVVRAQFFFAYITDTKELMVMYIDGYNDGDGRPPAYFSNGLTALSRTILIDEYGLDPHRVEEMMAQEAHTSGMDQAFQQVVERELTEEEEAEVVKWRQDIDTKIDSLFKHGGGS